MKTSHKRLKRPRVMVERIHVTLPSSLLDRIDAYAAEKKRSRSGVIRELVNTELNQKAMDRNA